MLKRKVMAMSVAGAVASLASAGASALEFNAGNWKMDISGSVNAFYTNVSCDKQGTAAPAIVATLPVCGTANQDSVAIQNGLLPGYINFTASTQAKGLDLKAVIGFWPGTSSGNGINNNATTPDTRTVYLEFGSKNWGSFKNRKGWLRIPTYHLGPSRAVLDRISPLGPCPVILFPERTPD